MPSKRGPLSSAVIKIAEITDDYTVFSLPSNIRLNKRTNKIERLYKRGERKDHWVEMPIYIVSKAGTARITIDHNSYSVARLIYVGYNPDSIDDINPILHKDGNKLNLKIDNLYIGRAGEAKSRRFGTYDPEWYAMLDREIPNVGERDSKNPKYMKLINMRKGADGLNHTERFFKRKKDAGLVLRFNRELGKSVWVKKEV